MPQARGTQTTVALDQETAYATDPGAPNASKLYIVKSTLRASQGRFDSNTLDASRARTRPSLGNIDVTGAIDMEISAENIGTILKHSIGTSTPTGVGPYTHTMTIASLPVGMVIEHDYGANISGSGRYEKFNGCRANSAAFTFPTEGNCMMSVDIAGAKSTLGATPYDATLTDNGHTPFSSFLAAIKEGGATIATVTQCDFKIENGLDKGVFALGGLGQRRALPEGFATITGTITALFEDATLLNKAVNDTTSSLQITLSRGTGLGTAGNESIDFLIQQLVYDRTSPAIEGPTGLVVQLPFRAYKVGANLGLQVTLKNAIATV